MAGGCLCWAVRAWRRQWWENRGAIMANFVWNFQRSLMSLVDEGLRFFPGNLIWSPRSNISVLFRGMILSCFFFRFLRGEFPISWWNPQDGEFQRFVAHTRFFDSERWVASSGTPYIFQGEYNLWMDIVCVICVWLPNLFLWRQGPAEPLDKNCLRILRPTLGFLSAIGGKYGNNERGYPQILTGLVLRGFIWWGFCPFILAWY